MPEVLPRLPDGCSSSLRYNTNQTAILTPLTSVNTPHHQATGFDQARELDGELEGELDREPGCARHSKLIDRSACNRTDI
jgi:hypothetical protein